MRRPFLLALLALAIALPARADYWITVSESISVADPRIALEDTYINETTASQQDSTNYGGGLTWQWGGNAAGRKRGLMRFNLPDSLRPDILDSLVFYAYRGGGTGASGVVRWALPRPHWIVGTGDGTLGDPATYPEGSIGVTARAFSQNYDGASDSTWLQICADSGAVLPVAAGQDTSYTGDPDVLVRFGLWPHDNSSDRGNWHYGGTWSSATLQYWPINLTRAAQYLFYNPNAVNEGIMFDTLLNRSTTFVASSKEGTNLGYFKLYGKKRIPRLDAAGEE